MKTKFYSFLSAESNIELLNFQRQLLNTATDVRKITTADTLEDISLLPIRDANEWLTNLPDILAYQIATNKLLNRQVYGIERTHFEEKLNLSRYIKKYLSRFNDADLSADNFL